MSRFGELPDVVLLKIACVCSLNDFVKLMSLNKWSRKTFAGIVTGTKCFSRQGDASKQPLQAESLAELLPRMPKLASLSCWKWNSERLIHSVCDAVRESGCGDRLRVLDVYSEEASAVAVDDEIRAVGALLGSGTLRSLEKLSITWFPRGPPSMMVALREGLGGGACAHLTSLSCALSREHVVQLAEILEERQGLGCRAHRAGHIPAGRRLEALEDRLPQP